MQTLVATLSLNDLVKLDVEIGRKIDVTKPARDPEGARRLLRQRKAVRRAIESIKAAANN